ncbi:Extracellular ribonuclease [Chryseobacterium aquaeductus]|uniref:Extracellular ribonuclease n=1 Tax=Chryseobacterium aquaeductus TaxID=2675056 RepID=A0A9N8MEF5_9FLAO|nr:endonuclease [Chryseobacterium aquaeductus]CAA7330129.1 Extracellular ribonuclease [Chryseobacterium potabilaquae]CAD7801479.1 Extracellular ribonuclease [Chryseobacterium aquaeductus]
MKRILSFFLVSMITINAFAQVPTGYYSTATGTGQTLKSQLNLIITAGHQDLGYGGLWTAYQTTDRDYFYENDGSILDIYSERPTAADPYNFTITTNQCGSSGYSAEGDCYNREHIVPQSLFNEASPMKNDVHFIRATDGKVNGERSNYPFGIVGNATFTSLNGTKVGTSVSAGYSGIVCEPIDAFKGDVARMIFYFVTRYETQLSGFSSGNMLGGSAFPGLQTWELNQLLAWHAADPVSAEEVARNNASYNYQSNRNPFIDNPAYVGLIWGTPVIDTQAPTAATNLVASNPTINSISLSWTAATDNTAVAVYDIYANGLLKTSVTGTTATISGLTPSTTYSMYVIAKDGSGNSSPQSNIVTETTLSAPGGGSCGTEDFSTMPATSTPVYNTQTWINNNITWTATDARIDETITGRAITIRNGNLTSTAIAGGIQSLTVTTQLKYSGTANNLTLQINGVNAGTIPYSSTVTTTTINNINVSGNFTIKIINPTTGNRIAIDDLSWSCFGTLGTSDVSKDKSFSIYPNPVKNNELFVKGENLNKISNADIYDLSGKLIKSIANPFKTSNKINLHGVVKGTYILKTDNNSVKFIVD